MFIAALFVIVKTVETTQHPSTDGEHVILEGCALLPPSEIVRFYFRNHTEYTVFRTMGC